MNIFHMLDPAQFLRLFKTPKIISNFNIFDIFFKTRDKIPTQLIKSLLISMLERVSEVNREKIRFTIHIKVKCT